MSFIELYFNGDYSSFAAYYGDYIYTEYKYVLSKDNSLFGVPNAGGFDSTDWLDTIVPGVGDDWELIGIGSYTPSIPSGSGFNGNYQRIELLSSDIITFFQILDSEPGYKYQISFKYKSDIPVSAQFFNGANLLFDQELPINTGDPVIYELPYFDVTFPNITVQFQADQIGYFEVDEIYQNRGIFNLVLLGPADWEKIMIKFIRSRIYHSVNRNYALSLKFEKSDVGGGLFILQEFIDNAVYGIMNIEIWERNTQTDDFILMYPGILDFKFGKFKNVRDFVIAGITDSSKQARLFSRDEIEFDIYSTLSADNTQITPFVNSPKSILYNGINVYLVVDTNIHGDPISFLFSDVNLTDKEIYFYSDPEDIKANEIGSRLKVEKDGGLSTIEIYENSSIEVKTVNISQISDILNTKTLFINPTTPISFNLQVQIIVDIVDSGDVIQSTNIVDSKDFIYANVSVPTEIEIEDFDFGPAAGNYIIPIGGKLRLYATGKLAGASMVGTGSITLGGAWFETLLLNEISIAAVSSEVNVTLLHELFTRCIQLTTGELDTSKLLYAPILGRTDSEFTTYNEDGIYSLYGMTSGQTIRQIPDATLNISLRNAFQSIDAAFSLTLIYDRLNNIVNIMPRNQAFKSDYFMFDLGEVSELEIEPLDLAYFNKLLAGWQDVNYDEVQGANEFNTKAEYSISTIIKKSYDAGSKIHADGTGQELTRRKLYSEDPQLDTKQDELIYLIETDGIETISGGSDVRGYNGVEENYNPKLSPRRCLTRHGDILLVALDKNDNPILFVKRQKNSPFEYLDEIMIWRNENSNITKQELIDLGYVQLFLPLGYRFKSPVTQSELSVLNVDANGFFNFSFNNIDYSAYIDTVEAIDYPMNGEWFSIAKEFVPLNKITEENNNKVAENEDNKILE